MSYTQANHEQELHLTVDTTHVIWYNHQARSGRAERFWKGVQLMIENIRGKEKETKTK
jgi:hypothetical protein